MKVLRYSAIAAAAIFAAACGDKVTVAGPTAVTLTSTTTTTTTTTPVVPGKINSIAVAPAAVTLTVGQAVTLVAAVNADPGVATTVTWSTSDATKVTVVAGLVTALAATPGVAICATSTVNVGVKGCASAVVVAASATVPATATIQGVYQTTTATPVTPSSVTGVVPVLVNVDPGTETLTKIYLKIGTVVADSQVFTAAQSAALRNAVETANETGAQAAGVDMGNAIQSIMLTANTAAYDATTGAVTYANGTAALSVQLFVAGNTAARSTATYSSNLTLNNADVLYSSWTLPSTKVQEADVNGYMWTSLGGGNMTVNVTPVLYSGKTISSATSKWVKFTGSTKTSCAKLLAAQSTGYCYSATAYGDTNQVKSDATLPISFDYTLYDMSMTRGDADVNVVTPPIPTLSVIYTDGSSTSDVTMTATAGTSLAIRVDNKAPADISLSVPLRGSTLLSLRSSATWVQRPATHLTDADSSKLVTDIGADLGVSTSPTLNGDLKGITWAVYASAGSATSTDSANVTTTAITTPAGFTEGSYYCVRVVTSDKLRNGTTYPDAMIVTAGTITTTTCPESGLQTRSNRRDDTAPVLTWSTTNYAQGDTAVNSIPAESQFKYVLTEANEKTGGVSVRACTYTVSGNAVTKANVTSLATSSTGATAATTCDRWVTQADYLGNTNHISVAAAKFASSALTSAAVYSLAVKAEDKAGNRSSGFTTTHTTGSLIKYLLVDASSAPTATAVAANSNVLGGTVSPAAYATDNLDVRTAALTMQVVGGFSSQSALTLNHVISSGNARIALVLEETPTAINSALGVPVSTRFYNVAISGSSAVQYIAPMGTFGDTLTMDSHAGSIGSFSTGILAKYRAAYAFTVYDQAGNRGIGASYEAGTVTDSITGAERSSRFAVVGNGLISGVDATSVDAGTAAAATNTRSISAALSAAAAAANAGYSQAKTLSLTLVRYRYQDKTGQTMLRPLAYRQDNNYCASNAATATTNAAGSAGADSYMAAGSQITSSRVPAVTAAMTVDVYAPLMGAASWGYVGAMTVSNSVTSVGAADGYCDDIVTTTYGYTWNVSTRGPATEWSNGQLVYLIKGVQGQATVIRGPYVNMVK